MYPLLSFCNIYIYIYIYIYIVLFGPVKPELGVIPSGQENHSGAEHLNFPDRELNVIDFTEQYFLKEKYKRTSSDPIFILYFSSCFWFTPETKNRMEIIISQDNVNIESTVLCVYVCVCVCVCVCV